MSTALAISCGGRLLLESADDGQGVPDGSIARRIEAALTKSLGDGLMHLATVELQTDLPPSFVFARDFACEYLTQLCHIPADDFDPSRSIAPEPASHRLDEIAQSASPMRGAEYLHADVLREWWTELGELIRQEVRDCPGGLEAYLQSKNPLWRLVGRVTFHLAENKRNAEHPFAFLATYTSRLSARGRPQHRPLRDALREYARQQKREALLSLLAPVHRAAQRSALVRELVHSNEVFEPQALSAAEAYSFLQEIPVLEESGLIVRVPDWWNAKRPPRPLVSVKIGQERTPLLGAESLMDFSVAVVLDGQPLGDEELDALLHAEGNLVSIRGRWVEIDRQKLSAALEHWKRIEQDVRKGGLTFFEGMRLLSGATLPGDPGAPSSLVAEWTGIAPGDALAKTLDELRAIGSSQSARIPGLQAQLRAYQEQGVQWLRFLTRLGLGACLADDMGLGKTIQVIALLLDLKHRNTTNRAKRLPSLLIVPTSLLANWQAELARFAPSLLYCVIHPSEVSLKTWAGSMNSMVSEVSRHDLAITTYGMLPRAAWLSQQAWNLVILDEAQAVKNAATRQARTVKQLACNSRVALTGTPIENRLSDLWSLFDFLNPGLLGSSKVFAELIKKLSANGHSHYGPLRSLIQPYLLRRLKTDKQIISDLPDKTEVYAYCGLTRRQVALYQRAVDELESSLAQVEGIQRRGVVLASLMRLKQICNHPSQYSGDGVYDPAASGKFERLKQICEELAQRQQKVLVFSQFREITAPLAEYLAKIFGRPGLVLHGQTSVAKRREFLLAFQRDDGPPFFVLSLKAGGVGLNLMAASHVIHFDRWWNPAVENQATDRAFRIGQKRNVLVCKFVCRGTIEERIDELIAGKRELAKELIDGGAEQLLTEMDNEQLLRLVALDINKALVS
jgi:SNF2-related domain/SNF2 Helicase protein/Helicase conserved C-terminal domain